jgi:hydrogenase-4 membrane subunit HyfE
MAGTHMQFIYGLNALAAGFVLLAAFGMVTTRQVQGVLRFLIVQSLFVAASAFLIGFSRGSIDLIALGCIMIASKVIAIPWVLKRMLPGDLYERREINQLINIPSSLLLALLLAIAAEFLVGPLVAASPDPVIHANLPIGLAGLLIGAYSLIARREAIPQLIGILSMENGAFFAGIAIAPDLPLIAELAIAIDVILIAVVVGVLTRNITETIGTTEAATMSELREEPPSWR